MKFKNRISEHLGAVENANPLNLVSYLSSVDARCMSEVEEALKCVYHDSKAHVDMLHDDPSFFSVSPTSRHLRDEINYFKAVRHMVNFIAEEYMDATNNVVPRYYTVALGYLDKTLEELDYFEETRKMSEESGGYF